MKKRAKPKSYSVPSQGEPDMALGIIKIQEQLTFLEKKVDVLIGQITQKFLEKQSHPKPFQHFDRPYRRDEARQDDRFKERTLHKAICADCSKECEVPFRPSGGRPVYCKECFGKRKATSPFNEERGRRPSEFEPAHAHHSDKHHKGEFRKSEFRKFGEKRSASYKKPKRRT